MTKALMNALAYVHAIGNVPSCIHPATRRALHGLTTHRDDYLGSGRFWDVTSVGLEEIADHPLRQAHDWLTAKGFRAEKNRRNTSRWIGYEHTDGRNAIAYREGGATINVPTKTGAAPFWRFEKFAASDIAAALQYGADVAEFGAEDRHAPETRYSTRLIEMQP